MAQQIKLEFVDDNREAQLINERLQVYEEQLAILRIDKLEGNVIPGEQVSTQGGVVHYSNVQPNPVTGAAGVPAPRFSMDQLDAEINRLEDKIKALRSRRDELTKSSS